jgi:GT2 family glycosyltransferase
MSAPRTTIAVVPAYNSEHLIPRRISELLKSSFKRVVICDDHSSDATPELLETLTEERVVAILGDHNLGPGGNRNRVLKVLEQEDSDFLFFIDADCQVRHGGDLGDLIDESFEDTDVGVVGFGILNSDGDPMKWNYGSLMHPVLEAADHRLEELMERKLIAKEQFMIGAPARAASYRLLSEKRPKEVGWVAEGCFATRTELFKELGGFDTAMRFHEAHDLSARVQQTGKKTVFNPIALAQHLEYDSRFDRRSEDEMAAKFHYFHKHWGMSEEVFRHLFDVA